MAVNSGFICGFGYKITHQVLHSAQANQEEYVASQLKKRVIERNERGGWSMTKTKVCAAMWIDFVFQVLLLDQNEVQNLLAAILKPQICGLKVVLDGLTAG